MWWWIWTAAAQDAVSLSAVRYAQDGLSAPSLTIHANVDGTMAVQLSCAGRSFPLQTSISSGRDYTLTLDHLARGATRCTGTLSLDAADGTSGQMPLSVAVEVLPPLKLTATRDDLDLKRQVVTVHGDRPLSHATVEVIGEGGSILGSGSTTGAGPSLEIAWSGAGEPIKLQITAFDEHELPSSLELSPWSYDIPHEDVAFASDAASLEPSELPKLERAWAELERVLARYGAIVQVRLFVAGYTDTVGDGVHNQTLSEARAKAIAAWFRSRGFRGEVRYQGFGESALAVATADQTNEPRNRRARYLLAAEEPARSTDLPRSQWRSLP